MIRASGARGPGFKSRTSPDGFFLSLHWKWSVTWGQSNQSAIHGSSFAFREQVCMIKNVHDSGGTRTHSLRIRSPARYPLRHGVYCDLKQFKDVWSFEALCQNIILFYPNGKCLFRLPRQICNKTPRLSTISR